MIRPSEDLALFRAEMAEWPGREKLRDWQQSRRDWVRPTMRAAGPFSIGSVPRAR
jgi:hypothetical protein